MAMKILVINGPNLNLLGKRDSKLYGAHTLDEIRQACLAVGQVCGLQIDFMQSNAEYCIIEKLHNSSQYQGIIINAAAYSHTSLAIMDALLVLEIPVIEVHLSNIFKREEFRQHSYVAKAALGVICGFGIHSYTTAIYTMKNILSASTEAADNS